MTKREMIDALEALNVPDDAEVMLDDNEHDLCDLFAVRLRHHRISNMLVATKSEPYVVLSWDNGALQYDDERHAKAEQE